MIKRRIKLLVVSCFGICLWILLSYYMMLHISLYREEEQEQYLINEFVSELRQDSYMDDFEQRPTDNVNYVDGTNSVNNADNTDASHNSETVTEGRKGLNENSKVEEASFSGGFDCILTIPSIELNKIVYTGEHREDHLQQYELITAAEDMQYHNGGNYIVCGHASQVYGHSLNRLKEIKCGDKVYIWNNHKKDCYKVQFITYEPMNETSSFCCQTKEQQITIISCAKYVAEDMYIVIRCTKE